MKAAAFAVSIFMTGAAAAQSPTPTTQAEQWVALVDAGDYAASWTAAGTIFRSHVMKTAWIRAAAATRKPLGTVVSRSVLAEATTKTLPGAPDGKYDIIQFATTFANKKAAVETVTLTLEPAGWRVDGYFVK